MVVFWWPERCRFEFMKELNEKFRVVIVDDEPIAREGVRVQVEKDGEAEIVRECRIGLEGVDAINDLSPDIAFLDVQMPEIDGLEVLQIFAKKPCWRSCL